MEYTPPRTSQNVQETRSEGLISKLNRGREWMARLGDRKETLPDLKLADKIANLMKFTVETLRKEERFNQRAKSLLEKWMAFKQGLAGFRVWDEVRDEIKSFEDCFAKLLFRTSNKTQLELRLLAAQTSLVHMAQNWRLLEEFLGQVSEAWKSYTLIYNHQKCQILCSLEELIIKLNKDLISLSTMK